MWREMRVLAVGACVVLAAGCGYFLLIGISCVRSSSNGACSDTASDTSLSCARRSIIGTTPAVERVTRLLARP